MADDNAPPPLGVANLDPRDIVGRIYIGITNHSYTQNKKALGLMVSEKKIFHVFPISMWELMPPGCSQFGTQGHDWQDLCRVPLNIDIY